MDGTRVDGDEIADTLYDYLLILAIEIVDKWSLLYLFLSGSTLYFWFCINIGFHYICIGVIFGFHLICHRLQSPFTDMAVLYCVVHGKYLSQSAWVRKPFLIDTLIICLATKEQLCLSALSAFGFRACLLTMPTIASKLLP